MHINITFLMKIVRTAVGLPEIHGLDLWSGREIGVIRMVLYIVVENTHRRWYGRRNRYQTVGEWYTRHWLFFCVCGYRYLAGGKNEKFCRTVIMSRQLVSRKTVFAPEIWRGLKWSREDCAWNANWWTETVYLLMDSVFKLTWTMENWWWKNTKYLLVVSVAMSR